MTRRQSMAVLGGLPVILLLGYVAYQGLGFSRPVNGQGPATSELGAKSESLQARNISVRVARLSAAGPGRLFQGFTGIVQPRRSSNLAAKTVGRVEHVAVDIGSVVTAGQVLVELDTQALKADRAVASSSLQAAQARLDEMEKGPRQQDIDQAGLRVDELQANLRLARSNLSRAQQLRTSGSISLQQLEETQNIVDATAAQLGAAQKSLELLQEGTRVEQIQTQRATVASLQSQVQRLDVSIDEQRIVAPYGGVISERMIDEGAVISPGQVLLSVVEEAPYEVLVGLPASLVRELSETDLRLFYDGQLLTAKIDRKSPVIDEAARTQDVVFSLSESSSSLVPLGAALRIEVATTAATDGYWLPNAALTAATRGLWAIYVAKPQSSGLHRLERRQVELVRSSGDWSSIKGPVDADELVVVEGVHRISPGQMVEIEVSEE